MDRVRVDFMLDVNLNNQLVKIAEEEGVSKSYQIRQAVRSYLYDKQQERKKK